MALKVELADATAPSFANASGEAATLRAGPCSAVRTHASRGLTVPAPGRRGSTGYGMGKRRKGEAPDGAQRTARGASRIQRWLKGAFEAHGAGNRREAERLARRVLGAVPDQPDALHLFATVARESDRTDLAIDLYRRLLRRHPAVPIAHNSLGNLLQARGEWQEAVACYEAALVHDPRYTSAYFNLGRVLLHMNDLVRAEHCLRQAAALSPNDAQVRARLGRALVEQGRQEEAMAETLRSLELDPGSSQIHNDAGVVHSTTGDFDTAREHYRAALALDPGDAKAALNLAKSKRFTAEHDEDADRIRATAGHCAADGGRQRDLHLALGKIHDDRGEWETAFRHYQQANRPFAAAANEQVDASLALMDRMRTVFDASWFASGSPVALVDPTPVFVVGMPRSGTTLVEQCLAAHPDVHGAGELSAILRLATEAATRAGAEADPLRTGVVSMNAVMRFGVAESYPECVRALDAVRIAALGEQYLAHLRTLAPGAARVTDKLPGNYLHLGFIATILPGATIIHCRRDPLDNAISLYFTDFMVGHEYSNDLHAIGRQIRGMRALMTHWKAVLGGRLLTIDYEALVADPEPHTRTMVAHAGLEWDDACLRPHEVKRAVHTASTWQVRQPVYRRSAGRAQPYARFLGPLRKALGESPSG